jgi:threonine dehydrogenase-like Zn-dependent dehydrogenase
VSEVELSEPKAGEVLVRLEACGVCHTDMYTASGADPSGYAPTVLGQRRRHCRAHRRRGHVRPAGQPERQDGIRSVIMFD